jgi:hypothetical protein
MHNLQAPNLYVLAKFLESLPNQQYRVNITDAGALPIYLLPFGYSQELEDKAIWLMGVDIVTGTRRTEMTDEGAAWLLEQLHEEVMTASLPA